MSELKSNTDEKQPAAFQRTNYLIMAVGYLLVVAGFLLMTGPGTTHTHFEPAIFNIRRIGIAPVICVTGFMVLLAGIVYKSRARH